MLIFNLYLYCSGQGLNVDLIWEMKIEVKAADPSFAIELNFHFLEWPHRQAARTNLVEHSKFTSNLQMIYKEKIEQYPLPHSRLRVVELAKHLEFRNNPQLGKWSPLSSRYTWYTFRWRRHPELQIYLNFTNNHQLWKWSPVSLQSCPSYFCTFRWRMRS